MVSWTTNKVVNSTQPLGVIYMAAGQHYSLLANITCSVDFKPKSFRVSVNKIKKTIRVTPDSDFAGTLDPDFHLRNIALEQLGIVSQVSTTLYFSAIGDALMANMANSAAADSPMSNLTTVADSFSNMLDGILLALTSAQTQLQGYPNASLAQTAPVQLELTVARIGSHEPIIALFALNAATLLVILIFMFASARWKRLPRFNFLDIASAVTASAIDGAGIWLEVLTPDEIGTPLWTGNQHDGRIGGFEVRVRQRTNRRGARRQAPGSSLNDAGVDDTPRQSAENSRLVMRDVASRKRGPRRRS